MSDPKTPSETPETPVSDTDQVSEMAAGDPIVDRKDEIEDAEILDDATSETSPDAERSEPLEDSDDTDPKSDQAETELDEVDTPDADAEVTGDDPALTEAHDTDVRDDTPDQTAASDADATEMPSETDTTTSDIEPEIEAPSIPEADPVAAKPPEKIIETIVQKNSFWSVFLGGVVAAGLGFGLCYYLVAQGTLQTAETETFDAERAQISALEGQFGALQSEVQTLAGMPATDPRVDAVAGAVETVEATLAEVQGELGAVQAEIEAQTGLLANLEAQMEAIAALPEGTDTVDNAAVAALQATLAQQQEENAAMQARLSEMASAAQAEMDAVRERAGELQSETQAAVDDASNRAFVAGLTAALENGSGFAPAIGALTLPAPDALSAVAETGVETLLDLQRQFPAAAREGLAESLKATVSDDPADRVFAFLRAQVGARSLEPREGDDPDAVLSRAQEAVNTGQLDVALSELAALPEEGQAAMASWIGAAQARVDALAALDTLAADINSN